MEIQGRMRGLFFEWLTRWGRIAAERFNQHSAPSFHTPYHIQTSNEEAR
jgi:hypothetical protein